MYKSIRENRVYIAIRNRLGRSITNLKGYGGYSGLEKDEIYVVETIMAEQEAHGGQFKVPIH